MTYRPTFGAMVPSSAKNTSLVHVVNYANF